MKYKSEVQKWHSMNGNFIIITKCLGANISKVYFIPEYESLISYVFCIGSYFFLAVLSPWRCKLYIHSL